MKRSTGRKTGYGLKWMTAFLAVLLLAAGISIIALGATVFNSRIFPNVYVDTISLGGLTQEEALAELEKNGWNEHIERKLLIKSYGDTSVEIDPVEAGVIIDAESAVHAASHYGRDNDPLKQFENYMICQKQPVDVHKLSTMLNTSYLEQQMDLLQERLDNILPAEDYIFDKEAAELKVFKGQSGLKLNRDLLFDEIVNALEQEKEEISFAVFKDEMVTPDFQAIYDEVYTEMHNAYMMDDQYHTVVSESTGYWFDVDAAKELWENSPSAKWVSIPVTITKPETTKAAIQEMLFRDLLGAVTTKYNNSGENRCSNVRLAAAKVNGTVLWPGEEFSFNQVVGERTIERGFLLAPAYAGYDDIKDEPGGGVCQVSTGVYAAALYAFLEIKAHTSHLYPPNYIQLGTDATVTIPEGGGKTIAFRFRNNKSYPIKIVAYCEETVLANNRPFKTVTVEIWGTLEPDDYMPIEFDNSYAGIYDYDRVIEPAYPDREGYKLKFTHEETEFEDEYGRGLRTLTHRKVYDSKGTLVEDTIINPTYYEGYAMDTYYYRK